MKSDNHNSGSAGSSLALFWFIRIILAIALATFVPMLHGAVLFSNLYFFTNGADGANPAAGLVQDSDGDFYSTTETGGSNGYGGG